MNPGLGMTFHEEIMPSFCILWISSQKNNKISINLF